MPMSLDVDVVDVLGIPNDAHKYSILSHDAELYPCALHTAWRWFSQTFAAYRTRTATTTQSVHCYFWWKRIRIKALHKHQVHLLYIVTQYKSNGCCQRAVGVRAAMSLKTCRIKWIL